MRHFLSNYFDLLFETNCNTLDPSHKTPTARTSYERREGKYGEREHILPLNHYISETTEGISCNTAFSAACCAEVNDQQQIRQPRDCRFQRCIDQAHILKVSDP